MLSASSAKDTHAKEECTAKGRYEAHRSFTYDHTRPAELLERRPVIRSNRSLKVHAVTARVGSRVDPRVSPRVHTRVRATAQVGAQTEVLLGSRVGVGTGGSGNLGVAADLLSKIVAGGRELLREGRAHTQLGAIEVDHVNGSDQNNRDTAYKE